MIDEATGPYKKRIAALYAEWKADPYAFVEAYPHVRISISRGHDPRAGAMRSIAEYVMHDNIRFGWDVFEVMAGDPVFIITSAA